METSYFLCNEPLTTKRWEVKGEKRSENCYLFLNMPQSAHDYAFFHVSIISPPTSHHISWPLNLLFPTILLSLHYLPLCLSIAQATNPVCKHANSLLMVPNSNDQSACLIMESATVAGGRADVGTIRFEFQLNFPLEKWCFEGAKCKLILASTLKRESLTLDSRPFLSICIIESWTAGKKESRLREFEFAPQKLFVR